jgi:hypothetical protein
VKGEDTENILTLFPGTHITTVRMRTLKHEPGLEKAKSPLRFP